MQKKLFKKSLELEQYCLFHDELGPRKANNKEWLYHGILFIPYLKREECYNKLLKKEEKVSGTFYCDMIVVF